MIALKTQILILYFSLIAIFFYHLIKMLDTVNDFYYIMTMILGYVGLAFSPLLVFVLDLVGLLEYARNYMLAFSTFTLTVTLIYEVKKKRKSNDFK